MGVAAKADAAFEKDMQEADEKKAKASEASDEEIKECAIDGSECQTKDGKCHKTTPTVPVRRPRLRVVPRVSSMLVATVARRASTRSSPGAPHAATLRTLASLTTSPCSRCKSLPCPCTRTPAPTVASRRTVALAPSAPW